MANQYKQYDISKEYLEEEYSNKRRKVSDIANEIGCCKATIGGLLRKYNIQRHTDQKNIDYFNKWSANMAYILGFTCADGCVHAAWKEKWKLYTFSLQYNIHSMDVEILEFIRDEISPFSKIYFKNKYNMVHLCIGSNEICDSLTKHYIIPRKTGLEKLPDVPDKFFGDWLRGFFDGDGYVGFKHREHTSYHYRFEIVSHSEGILKELKDRTGLCSITNKDKYFRWYTGSRWDITKLYDIMYSGSGFCLNRKKITFDKILEIHNEPGRRKEYRKRDPGNN